MKTLIIDANVYWFPERIFEEETLLERFLTEIPEACATTGKLVVRGGKKQIVIERPAGCPGVDYVQGDYTLEGILAALDAGGVDQAVLKVPCCHEWMGLDMCRLFNDGMADYVTRSKGRLAALAVVPPEGTPEQLSELERCNRELGMKGAQLCAHYGERYLDDEAFAPLFEKLEELHMTAYIHHTPVPTQYDALCSYTNLRRSYGRCCDQMIAVSRELFSGMLGRYPHVRVVHSMLGGGFFTYLYQMLPSRRRTMDTAGRFEKTEQKVRNCLENQIYFEMSHAQPWGKAVLECAVTTLGADHVVYGSSYPVCEAWTTGGPEFVKGLDISQVDQKKILGENARSLYFG